MKTPALPDLLRLGSSSFSCTDWVGPFYPPGTAPGDFLVHYAGRYDTVEIDSTYYAVPSARMDPVTAGFAYVRLLGDREAIENVVRYMSRAALSVERVRYNRAEDSVTFSKKPFGSSREESRSYPVGETDLDLGKAHPPYLRSGPPAL